MRLLRILALACTPLMAVTHVMESSAQTTTLLPSSAKLLVKSLKDSIRIEQEEIQLLQHFLEAATVDTRLLRNANLKAWTIANPAVRDSLFSTLMDVDSSIQSEAGSEAEVLATQTDDILEVRFGSSVFKGMTLKNALDQGSDRDLYRKVARSYRYSKDIELRNPRMKLPTEVEPEILAYRKLSNAFALIPSTGPHPAMLRATFSLNDLAFKIGPTWGGEVKLGKDELDLPFWSLGDIDVMATYDRVKFGLVLPFGPGKSPAEFIPALGIKARTLSGTRGVTGEFDFGAVAGTLMFTQFNANDKSLVTDPNNFAYISGAFQMYYSFGVAIDMQNSIRMKAGFGLHRVDEARFITAPDAPGGTPREQVDVTDRTLVASPYVKFEYLNGDVTGKYAASIQYYNLTIMLVVSLDIVPGIVSIEGKFVHALLKDEEQPWVVQDFLVVSPRVRLAF